MVRRRLLIVAVAVVAGLAAGYWHVAGLIDWRGIGTGTVTSRQGSASPDAEPRAALDAANMTDETAAEISEAPEVRPENGEVPSIELLRVEPDGGTVVAGRATPGSTVSILSDGAEVARETASASGEFAIVLDDPLSVGEHQLTLRSSAEDGTERQSSETAVVSVPAAGRESELLVMLQSPDRPTEVIERPGGAVPPAQRAEEPASETDSIAAIPNADPDAPSVGPAQTAAIAPAVEQAPSAVPPSAAPVGIGAIEIEGDRLFVAGAAAAGASVRLYVDDAFVGETTGSPQGDFYASVPATVAVGDHVVRADVIGPDGSVVARVEVPFDRPNEGSMSAVAALPNVRPTAPQTAPAPPNAAAPSATTPPAPASSAIATRTAPQTSTSRDASASADAPATSETAIASAPTAMGQAPATGAERARVVANAIEPSAVSPSVPAQIGAGTVTTNDTAITDLPVVQQAALQPVDGRVLIRRGDTLWRISRDTYGQGARYTVIYLANGDQIRNPDLIYPGQIFRMPDETTAN